jgi:hypothetical protein
MSGHLFLFLSLSFFSFSFFSFSLPFSISLFLFPLSAFRQSLPLFLRYLCVAGAFSQNVWNAVSRGPEKYQNTFLPTLCVSLQSPLRPSCGEIKNRCPGTHVMIL